LLLAATVSFPAQAAHLERTSVAEENAPLLATQTTFPDISGNMVEGQTGVELAALAIAVAGVLATIFSGAIEWSAEEPRTLEVGWQTHADMVNGIPSE
jgi:hypothetical protein